MVNFHLMGLHSTVTNNMEFRQKTIKFQIRGDEWKIILYSPTVFVKKFLECSAITETEQKFVAFDISLMTEPIVLHELVHVYISYQHYGDAGLDLDQFEEIFCTMFEKQGHEIISLSQEIWNKIKKYKIVVDEPKQN